MLTPEELKAIREREQKATEGEWNVRPHHDFDHTYDIRADDLTEVVVGTETGSIFSAADAAFIAHSRQDIPALLSHIEEMEARLRLIADQQWVVPVGDACIGCKEIPHIVDIAQAGFPLPND